MTRDFFDPPWEETHIKLVDQATIRRAQQVVLACETCEPVEAEIPFDWILTQVTGCDPSVTDYVLEVPAHCPNCGAELL